MIACSVASPGVRAQDNASGSRVSAPTRPGTAAARSIQAVGASQPISIISPQQAQQSVQMQQTSGQQAPMIQYQGSLPAAGLAAYSLSPLAIAPGASVQIGGVDCIDLPTFAKSLGLKVSWIKPAEQLELKNAVINIGATGESREWSINGLRVFSGAPVRMYKRSLWVSRIDAAYLLAPLVNPARGGVVPGKPRVIAIDPGHGGIDKGKINERLNIFEKNMALDTAMRLKLVLEKRGFRVVMTRTTDVKIELSERPEIARRAGADLFVSVHFNSVEQGASTVSGIEVYRFTPRYQQPVTRSKFLSTDNLENLSDTNTFWNTLFAFKMQQTLLSELGASDRGCKHDKLAVLRLASCPAILIEGGFLSNEAEARKIMTPAYRQKLAESIANGIQAYAEALPRAR